MQFPITLLGDFNAEVRNESYLYPMWRAQPSQKTNDNEVVNFALARDLAVTGTWYQY